MARVQFEDAQVGPVGEEGEQVAAEAGAERGHEVADASGQAGQVLGGEDEQGRAADAGHGRDAVPEVRVVPDLPGERGVRPDVDAFAGGAQRPLGEQRGVRSASGRAIASAWASKTAFSSASSETSSSGAMPS
ncbi:hypothetical protein BJF79_19070 [Actinomadura sp. CNU-125]|uniref:hypothetical protein n=1 Tax=Actinomadura sp. CNU-125 TaxID=1904961 RepID=UPI000966C9A5|nr:hypothetical protein [Actinomadura sp. CNU-125]OLT14560.1 hypothetical protein BJF79_19070 [Actinomadura sp. CNU-125]